MKKLFRLLFIGDVVGPTGCAALQTLVPNLRRDLALDAVIANGENSANNGFGITVHTAETLLAVVDFLTLGDHAFDQEEIGPFLDREPRIVRPANLPTDRPGRGWGLFTAAGVRVGVINLLGRALMREPVEPPLAAAERAVRALTAAGAQLILLDMQAEATSEKQGMGWYLAGRVAAVMGTHTHTPTADLRILPGGTAYVTDVGMTGGKDGIIGFSKEDLLQLLSGNRPPRPPRPATGPARLDAVLIEVDIDRGRAVAAQRVFRDDTGRIP